MEGGIKQYWKSSGKLMISLVSLAAVLPVLMMVFMDSQGVRILTRADEVKSIRVWFEPEEVIVKSGESVNVEIWGDYTDNAKLISELKVNLIAPVGMKLNSPVVSYKSPLSGKALLGKVEVSVDAAGRYVLEIPEGGVTSSSPESPVSTGKAVIIAKDP